MSQAERFEYLLVVKDDANPAIKQAGENAATLGGKATAAAKGLDALEHSVTHLRTSTQVSAGAMDGYAKKTMSFTDGVKGLQARMGPAAAAVAGLSAALGQQGGEAGKALAAVGQLAAAFAVGGPLMLAVTGATLAMDMFFADLEKQEKQAAALIEKDNALIAAARERRDAALSNRDTAANERKQVEAVNALRARGYDDEARRTVALGDLQVQYMALVKRIADEKHDASKSVMKQELKALGDEMSEKLKTVNAEIAGEKAAAARARWAAKAREDAQAAAQFAHAMTMDVLDAEASWRKAMEGPSSTNAISGAMLGFEEKKAGLAVELEQKKSEGIMREHERVLANRKATDAEAERQANEHYGRLKDATKAFHDGNVALGLSSFSMLTSAGSEFFDNVITGQDHATEKFASSMLKQTGSALVSYGTTLAAKAVVDGFTPGLQPLAIAEGVTAAGMIATGMALGAAGTAVQHVAAGGTIGKALPDDKKSAARTSTGSGSLGAAGGSTGREGVNITIVYGGVSGPEAESGARNLTTGLGLAQRRGRINKRVNHR